MTPATQICGVSTPEAVRAAVEGGAAFLGFMFFPQSPRNIDPEAAGRLAPPARARGVRIVAVVVDPSDNEIDAVMAGLAPDLIQLHGKEPPARVREIGERTGRGII